MMRAAGKYVTNCGIPRRAKGVTGFTHSPGNDSRDGNRPLSRARELRGMASIPLIKNDNSSPARRGPDAGDSPGGRGMGLAYLVTHT